MLTRIGKLRVEAWRRYVEVPASFDIWLDGFDDIAYHFAYLLDGWPVAAARMSIHNSLCSVPDAERYIGKANEDLPTPIASFNRLVVGRRGKGLNLAAQLDSLRISTANELECQCIIAATTHEGRVEKMAKLGFVIIGDGNVSVNHPVLAAQHPKILLYHF